MLQAAIAALHTETPCDWARIAALYDELVRLTGSPVVELNRAIAIAETDGPEAGLRLIDRLESRSKFPRPSADELGSVWCTVLAGVHRGGRQKPKAVRQVARAIEDDPGRADDLLPVLALATRSIRAPEMREALAAVVSLVESRPDLREAVEREFPELKFVP